MNKKKRDRALGMDAEISRRDFLDGAAITVGGTMMVPTLAGGTPAHAETAAPPAPVPAPQAAPADYPPRITGMRGQTDEAMNAGHAVRDGSAFNDPVDTGELYDLVVVGAGMAGLGAAYFYRKQIPHSKVLVIDACPDFGGHAVRNEFMVDGTRLIAGGGTAALWRPNTFPPEAQELMRDIGIDRAGHEKQLDNSTNAPRELGLRRATFFGKDSFGEDRLVMNPPPELGLRGARGEEGTTSAQFAEFFAQTPYSAGTREGLLKLFTEHRDWMSGVPTAKKVEQLKKMSYIDFVSKVVKIHPDAVAHVLSVGATGGTNQTAGPDTYSAWYAWRKGAPGFKAMALPPASQLSNLVKDPGRNIAWPDSAATAARLLVRWLIPDALPGRTADDSVLQQIDYAALDRPTNDVRVRLSSTVIRAQHLGDPQTAKEVEVTYLRDGRPQTVRARGVVMACFNAIVPYLVPDLPESQKAALHEAVRKPLVATNVAIRNWRAFQKLGVSSINCPAMFFSSIGLSVPAAIGGYQNASTPDEPIVVRMSLTARILEKAGSGLPPREQWKAARAELQEITFEMFERNIREQLDRVLGPGGFDAQRDVAGIIINRWSHAYAPGSNELYDRDWSHRMDAPWVVGRQQFGRITISNSDAAFVSLTNAAWQQSHRCVNELICNVHRPVFDWQWSESMHAGEPGDFPNNF